MPAQDGARGDQAMAAQRSGQPPDERGEHGPVRPLQARSGVGAAEHGDLVAQHEELDVLGGGRAAQQQEQPEHLLEDQIQQPQRHGGDHARPLAITITAGQRHVQHSGTPQAARDRGQRANRRLHARWAAFDARLKLPVVANTAIARELAGWCWSLAVLDD